MIKISKKQLTELAESLNAKYINIEPCAVFGNIIAYSWNKTNGHKTAVIFWRNGEICTTEQVKQ